MNTQETQHLGADHVRAMSAKKTLRVGQGFTWLLTIVAALALMESAHGQVNLKIPDDIQPPIYTPIDGSFLPHTEELAVIYFYRSPECIPVDFNFFDFLDLTPAFPGGPPRPFLCELQVQGRVHLASLADPFPAEVFLEGTGAVPFWFVSWPEMQAAVADGVLTITELAALPSLLTGTASFFLESIRNTIRGERPGNEEVVATGQLTDGRSFQVLITEKCCFKGQEHIFNFVKIEIK